MILVTGATGQLGSLVVESLLGHLPASELAAGVRRPEAARPLAERGVDVRRSDYDEPDTLARSFAGIDRLLLISSSGIDHETRAARHRNAIDAAARAGVGRVFYTSLLPPEGSEAYVMKAHLDTEVYLQASGLRHTILKHGVYAEAWGQYLGESGEVTVPADGPISWVARADLAEGAARLLIDDAGEGDMVHLTGPEALTVAAVAALLKRPVRIVTEEVYVDRLKAAGKPEEYARRWATTYLAIARGEFGVVDPLLGQLLGRPLRTMEEALAG